MPQNPADAASLTVLAGPLKGHRLVLDDAVDDVLIGSDPDCRLALDVPGVSPIHARLWLDPQGATVYDTHSAGGVYVNDDRVSEQAPLRDGDILWLGPPAEPGSVMLQFRHPVAAEAAEPAFEAPFEAAAALDIVEPAGPASAEPAPGESEPPAAPEEWLIEDLAGPEAPPATPPRDPLEDVLEDAGPAAPAPVPEEDFYVIEDAEPAAPEAAPTEPAAESAEGLDDDFFDWGAQGGESEAPAEPAPEPSPFGAGADDALLLDWTEPPASPASPPAPVSTPPPARVTLPVPTVPAPAAPPPLEDQDVFYVESTEPPPPPAEPAPSAPVPPQPEPALARSAPPAHREPSGEPPVAHAPAAVVGGLHVPRPRPAAREAPPPRAHAPAPRPSTGSVGGKRALIMGGGAVLALVVGGLIAMKLLGAPRIDSISPTRARGGDTVVIQGRNFSTDEAAVVVRFGEREGRILRASPTRLEVEVPSIPAPPGKVSRVPVSVSVGGRESKLSEVSVYQAPRIHGIAPSVALPGEEVTLAGADWGPGATVRFGTLEAQILEISPTSVRVRVPALDVPQGTALPVVVAMAGDTSNEMPFHLGRLPLLISVEPPAVNAGDPIVIKGLGFAPRPSSNDLRIGGTRAVVVKASETELLAMAPRTPGEGQHAVELRVPGVEHVAQSTVTVAPPADPIEFRFIVEHLSALGIDDPANGHDHVVLSTGLGPAFLISAADGVSAAERAAEAQRRFADAAVALRASLTADLEVRGLEGLPSIGLVGKQEPLLVVTGEDANAYEEEWARGRGAGEAVTPARLAMWWGAVARDLVLLLVRGDRPRHAAALAPEGRALATLHDAARRPEGSGFPRAALVSAPGPLRQSVRNLAFRVPAAVKPPAEVSAAAAPVQPLVLDGMWTGSETEESGKRYMTVTFSAGTGTFTYERALSLTIPLQSVQQTGRRAVKFDFRSGLHQRQYEGVWDGQRLRGRILAEDGAEIGSFELERKR
jgi:hypothetical protein